MGTSCQLSYRALIRVIDRFPETRQRYSLESRVRFQERRDLADCDPHSLIDRVAIHATADRGKGDRSRARIRREAL
jgi:hypothetical protein